jgi:hypothetical protein
VLAAQCEHGFGPGGVDMMPTEFERHGGCGSFKKWKKSILVRIGVHSLKPAAFVSAL